MIRHPSSLFHYHVANKEDSCRAMSVVPYSQSKHMYAACVTTVCGWWPDQLKAPACPVHVPENLPLLGEFKVSTQACTVAGDGFHLFTSFSSRMTKRSIS